MTLQLHNTKCAICDSFDNSIEIYPANFNQDSFNEEIYSARRMPDMIHFRIVKCKNCELVRSDPIINIEEIHKLYFQSKLTYSKDVPNLQKTYGNYLRRLEKYRNHKDSFLEIGCGNGFLLEEALSQGYENVIGIEPSSSAISQAKKSVRDIIINDVFRPGIITRKVDTIGMFQLFDHIADPNSLLQECHDILNDDGLMICFNHNIDAFSSKVFKEKSPIIDIEHTYLYSKKTISKLFEKNKLKVLEVGSAWNLLNLVHITKLMPFPKNLKQNILKYFEMNKKLGELNLTMPIGNLFIIAKKV